MDDTVAQRNAGRSFRRKGLLRNVCVALGRIGSGSARDRPGTFLTEGHQLTVPDPSLPAGLLQQSLSEVDEFLLEFLVHLAERGTEEP
jgi:hypothetical protein